MATKETVKKTATKSAAASKAAKSTKINKVEKAVKAKPAQAKGAAKTPKKQAQAREKTETFFRLGAPQAREVSIVGCFNEWDAAANLLEPDGDGNWSCVLVMEPGEYEYRFVIDGVWCDDPANMVRRPNEFGTENCVLII